MGENGKHPDGGRTSPPTWPKRRKQREIVGTREVAEMLGVERSRIGKWRKRGIMPPVVQELEATPVWWRSDVEKLIPWVEANRRQSSSAR